MLYCSSSPAQTALTWYPDAATTRATLMPLPAACSVMDTARCTSPRRNSASSAIVRSMLGLAVKVTTSGVGCDSVMFETLLNTLS